MNILDHITDRYIDVASPFLKLASLGQRHPGEGEVWCADFDLVPNDGTPPRMVVSVRRWDTLEGCDPVSLAEARRDAAGLSGGARPFLILHRCGGCNLTHVALGAIVELAVAGRGRA